ncbi:hypothetical protein NQ317_007513 [Molorchus minor]|uniref:Uncharacterized protein n=1 Tax=Molorchus minor TaxID=1323400 RepID=A0ABQ9J0Z9_9CUCU|nr:hypothetical protein NQ317_007513 [Molorchus minor]
MDDYPLTNLIVNEEKINKEKKRKVMTFLNTEKEKVDYQQLTQEEEFKGLEDNKLKNFLISLERVLIMTKV